MENWKERFEYIYVIEENKGEKYLRKYDHTTIVEELEHFISQELDKAREEGRKEGMVGMLELAEKHSFPLSVVLNNKEIARKLKELSKLKTKE